MLTREHAIAVYNTGLVQPDRLTRRQHAQYPRLAESMLRIYRNGIGQMRQQLKNSVHRLFEDELQCPTRRIEAFCKLLDEKSTFDTDHRGNAADLRKKVFRLAAHKHPLVQSADRLFESSELETKQAIADQIGLSWPEIEQGLFADVMQFHRLRAFEGYESAQHLLARYNVSQTQAVLYDAVSMSVWARDDFKLILRYAKLARLMHTITRKPDGTYLIRFDGPVSVLKQTRRYGVAFAKFLPALLSCSGWKMSATIEHRRSNWQNQFELSPADGLTTHVKPADLFDSKLEEDFANKWGEQPREGWRMVREGEVLFKNQKVFVPDFLFVRETGRRVLMEVVGFWTPEYLESKHQTLSIFDEHKILLAVANSIDWPDSLTDEKSNSVIRYKTVIKVKDVLEHLNRTLASS